MPGKSASAYLEAADRGETLAMNNLGYLYKKVGFFQQAEEQFARALSVEGFHKNAATGMAALKAAPEDETERKSTILTELRPKAAYCRRFGRAITKPDLELPESIWLGPRCELLVHIKSGRMRARGSYERPPGLMLALGAGANQNEKRRMHLEYEGEVRGHTVSGTVHRWNDDEKKAPKTLLGGLEDPGTGFWMTLDDSAGAFHTLEDLKKRKPTFCDLVRKT